MADKQYRNITETKLVGPINTTKIRPTCQECGQKSKDCLHFMNTHTRKCSFEIVEEDWIIVKCACQSAQGPGTDGND